ncbi:MAG: TonB-dependent receptor [Edaphobacter sp.]|uniref:TonB-dependent receptor n=1 Tax=Edaphobacter sp. TaxID=1934404 RepID=UPI00239234A7|nr:carboxypeptidase regulatory-like domain-containing protein [Edaphobacter sp.]MDE1175002.1 TonB-dependent receptor [Edaphobacter sp.]
MHHLARRAAFMLLTLSPLSLFAQKDSATLQGLVTDGTGAVVPGAKVLAKQTETNATYNVQSDSAGQWTLSPVKIGTYTVTISADGFRPTVFSAVKVDVQQRQQLDSKLQTGSNNEVITVTERAPLLETSTSERSQLIDSQTMVNLSLNGRNPVQLAQLSAGVTMSEPGSRDESGYGFSANGARSLQNNFLLDGIDNNSYLPDLLNETNYVIMPSVDALQEFRVSTNSYSAEFGRATGAVVNASLKSGTNQFHGVVYEFLRNEAFDARNYFDTRRPPYKQNQFGATLGGPIVRNKLFFFVDYEGLRIRQGLTDVALVPTQAQRNGDFSSQLDLSSPTGVSDCNGMSTYAGELFDTKKTQASAASSSGYCGVPFGYNGNLPSNVIPASRQDGLGAKLAALYPQPNYNGSGYNYAYNPIQTRNRDQGDARVDQTLGHNDTAFYRFSMSRQPAVIPGPFTGLADGGGFFTGIEQNNGYSIAASETHIFSPKLVNEFRIGYNRLHSSRYQFNYGEDVSGTIGFPGVPYTPGTDNGGLPQLSFNDMATIGSPTYLPSNEIQNTYILSDTLTRVMGSHSLKFGGEVRRQEFTIYQPAAPRGYLSFGTQYTDNPAAQGSGGSGFATLLTGQPGSGGINNLNNVDYFRNAWSVFALDDWRVTPRLTFNLGIRYEYYSPITERHNAQANFNPDTGQLDIPRSSNVSLTPTLATLLTVNHNAPNALIAADRNNFAPRVGLAYSISKNLLYRSGFGMFFNGDENGPYSNPSPGFNPPYFSSQSFNANCSQSAYTGSAVDCSVPGLEQLSNGFPSTSLSDPNTPNLFSENPRLRTPYVIQWHGTLQYQAGTSTVLELGYVGSKGTKLYTFSNLNQAAPTADASSPTASRRPFPMINASISNLNGWGYSFYDGLQARVEHRFGNGLSALVNYTYSHALGNSSNANLGSQNNDSFRWSKHPEWEYGNLDFDVRHRFVASYTYQLPIGRGKLLLGNMGNFANVVIGGWQTSGIATLSTGTYFTVTDSNAGFANSDGQQRPDFVPGVKASDKPCVAGTYFNTCAFADPALGSFGNVSLNSLKGPGMISWDASLMKEVPIHETTHLEFRAELFNVLNHTNFLFAAPGPQNGINSTVMGSSQFGYVTAARDPRQIQLALKLYY